MACYYPLDAWQYRHARENGKRGITFKWSLNADSIQLPCGQCIGCRLERSRQWAIRCMHEAQMHPQNCFITLTYDDDHLPEGNTLVLRDFQLFMKKLRKRYPQEVRFFHCGEYGEKTSRPHYHAILFNIDFDDKQTFKVINGNPIWTSEKLSQLWPQGFSTLGAVTFKSAAYVARYVMKKVTGEKAQEHYEVANLDTGQVIDRKPEYTTMSRRPGIGKTWISTYKTDVYPHDYVIINGKEVKPPKYYDTQYEIEDFDKHQELKTNRKITALKYKDDNTKERLKVKERVKLSKIKQLPRTLE